MNTTETITRALLGCLDTNALEASIVNVLKDTYSPEELSTQLQRAADILGVEQPEQAIKVEISPTELAALKTARDVLARL